MSKQQNYEPLSPAPMDTDESIIDFDSRELLAMASGEYISILETLDEDALLAEDMEVEDQIDAALEQIEEVSNTNATYESIITKFANEAKIVEDSLVSNPRLDAKRSLQMGDLVEIISFEWLTNKVPLTSGQITFETENPNWINSVSRIICQAKATKLKSVFQQRAALSAYIDQIKTDLSEAQVVVVPEIEETKGNIIILNFEYILDSKKQLVKFVDSWEDDSPLSIRLNSPDSKPCASGRLQGGQRETARLILDDQSRGVYQQAPPGTGKTFTAMSIIAALLKKYPETHILCVAPLNVAVVKMCEELAEALKVEGIDEKVLALFSACAVDSPEFTIKLEESELKKVEKYKKACTSHPRLAAEGTIAQLLLSHEKRRLREIGIEIGNRSLTGIQTLSADAMQGHETDLAIVVTTATQRNESGADKSVEFWADPARANVALSRGKHGLIIIGDLKYLMNRGGIWNRFISKAMEFTVVADSIQYCNAMQNTEAQYIRGTLHVNGRTVQDYNFYAGSAKSYNLNQYYPSNSDRPRRAEKREWAPSNCNRCGKKGHTERECRN
uniref:CCHC-type domain-containing protein n=1 Tax=Meloidogyne javanica TaxID=6303 RepID=A0A915LQF5_MELJA